MMREADLTVILDDNYGNRHAVAVKIAGPFMEAFEPMDVCSRPDTALLMALTGKNAYTEDTVVVVRKKREGYAKILAAQLAAQIVKAMEAKDTRDGYERSGDEP